MKRTKILFMVLLIAITTVTIYSNGQNESGSSSRALTLYHTGDDGNALQKLSERYLEETGKVLEVVQIPYDSHREKIIGMIRAKQTPALLKTTEPITFSDFALPLDDIIDESRLPNATKGDWSNDGNIISLPVTATANGMWINKTLFDKAGVKYPTTVEDVWTWDEFSDAVLEVQEKTGVLYGLGWDVTPHRWSTLLYEFGGSIFEEGKNAAAINEKESVDALEYFMELHEKEVISKAFWIGNENPRDAFMGGQMVAHLSGSWMANEYKNIDGFEAALTYLPSKETRSSLLGGNYLMILKDSGLEDEAIEFMEWFTEDEQFATYVADVPTIAPLKNVEGKFTDTRIKNWMSIFQDELEATSTAAGYDWSGVDGSVRNKVMSDYKDAIIAAIKGDKTAQEAFDQVAEAINSAFESRK